MNKIAYLIKLISTTVFYLSLLVANSQSDEINVKIRSINGQHSLLVNNQPFFIKGINWDYYPIGTNYTYNFWTESDEKIMKVLDQEMSHLKHIGVNSLRLYNDIPPRWIEYIFKKYGIYTIINHSFGRYGLLINENWVPQTDYGSEKVLEILLEEISDLAKIYRDTPGLLMYMIGNENNYGLHWSGAGTENIPETSSNEKAAATALYKAMEMAIVKVKSIDKNHPVAICNGDLLYLEIIKHECPSLDVLGINSYRGASFGDTFKRVGNVLGKPLLFTEFGADAYNAKTGKEDEEAQAYFVSLNYQEIIVNAAGLQGEHNSLGGFVFQFSDGWWKHGQTVNLGIHDTEASWQNGGYTFDFTRGLNNMNEEWFGICSKIASDTSGNYLLKPRKAYYVIRKINQIDPYHIDSLKEDIGSFFSTIHETNK